MKKIQNIHLILLLLLGVTVVGCSDFLEANPESSWGEKDFYSSPIEADIALAGIYGNLATDAVYGQGLSVIMASGTDEGYYNRRYNENWTVGLYRHTSSDNYVKNSWATLYETINLTNLFILNLDESAFEADEYKRYMAEAHFLRGLCYAELAAWWGPVPVQLEPTRDQSANNLAASSLEEVYQLVIDDLSYAAENLWHVNDPNYVQGRANKMAAHGLMARVYLRMAGYPLQDTEKYALAKEQCDIIINDGYYSLNTSGENGYREHFLSYIQNKFDLQESMFEIAFTNWRDMGLQTDGRIGGINGVSFNYGGGADGYPAAYAMENAAPALNNLFEADDLRHEWNIAGYKYGGNGDAVAVNDPLSGQFCPGKYRRWEPANWDDLYVTPEKGVIEAYITLEAATNPSKNFTGINWPILRYSDVLLMAAEAINELEGPTGEAVGYLNQVRNRAGLENIETVNPGAIAGKENFFNELVDERSRELCFEGLRKQDLIRWGLLGDKLQMSNAMILGEPSYSNTNENHNAYLRAGNFFDASKHLSLPYPLQEVQLNNLLDQKSGW